MIDAIFFVIGEIEADDTVDFHIGVILLFIYRMALTIPKCHQSTLTCKNKKTKTKLKSKLRSVWNETS